MGEGGNTMSRDQRINIRDSNTTNEYPSKLEARVKKDWFNWMTGTYHYSETK
jgi:hypothetical protein